MIVAGVDAARRLHDRRDRQVRRRRVVRRRRRRDADARRGAARRRRAPAHYDQIDVAAAPGVTPATLRARIRAALPRNASTCAPARSRPPSRPPTSKATSASCARSCSSSPTSRCSSARSSSSTPSRSPSPSARASSGCCARSARRARQVLQSVVAKGCCSASAAPCSACSAAIALAPALDQLFKAFGADLPDSGTVRRDAHDRRVAARRHGRDGARRSLAGAARDARAAARGDARGRRDPAPQADHARSLRRSGPARARAWCDSSSRSSRRWLRRRSCVIVGDRHRAHVRAPAPARTRSAATGSRAGLARAIGSLVSWRGITGRLARENTIRQPGRTLMTAAALTVGLALVTLVAVLAAGTKATINQPSSRSFAGNLIVENSQRQQRSGDPRAPRAGAAPRAGRRRRHADRVHRGRACGAAAATPVDHRRSIRRRSRASTASNGSTARTRRCAPLGHDGHGRHQGLRRIAPPARSGRRSRC